MDCPEWIKKYDAGGELLQEGLEVEGLAVGGVVDLLDEPEDELVFGIESEGAGSEKDISCISSSLAGIGIEGEEGVQFGNAVGAEHWVLGTDVLGKHCLQLFLLDLTLGHYGSGCENKI